MTLCDGVWVPDENPDSRFIQANERTLLAWVRTGLGLLGLGFVIARFGATDASQGGHHMTLLVAGLAITALTPITIFLAIARYLRVHRALVEGRPTPVGTRSAVFVASAAAVVALLVLGGLIAAAH